MKSKKLVTKAMTLTLIGATILGSSSSLYAKSHRPGGSRPHNQASHKPGTATKPQKPNNSTNVGTDNEISNDTNTGIDCEINNGTNAGTNNGTSNGGNTDTDCEINNGNNIGTDNGTNNDTSTGTDNGTNNDTNTGNDSTTDTDVSTQTAYENKVLELVNAERAKQGLKPLEMDESVRNVARLKSQDMKKNNYFSHTSPTYGTPFEMLKKYGISYKSAGENIAQGYQTPEQVVKGWMNSSGHRANILNASYTHIGIGYEADGNYWTQMFIGK
ncbi:CAP domain-containing protein [Cellulosilyticum sp. WCF-2]|uniref:CAP domain-containing protein n=1 Tax=Cellulosilyticum sp. WCF-2 TaxID=2497860 RepID=UPI001A9A9CE9|nr:CAP domain-containing protein [Cellulosilyticum sp. WCF-2]